MKIYYIYILTNKTNTTLYIGVTSNLGKRVAEHKEGIGSKFTEKYNVNKLIYFEEFSDIRLAIDREKQLKNWHREWKINLIKTINPDFKDLLIENLD